jgi:ribokinase
LDNEGERTFLTYSGSQFLLTDEMVQAALLVKPSYVHLSGYSLIEYDNAGRIINLLEKLKVQGSKIFFDPSPLCKEIDRDILQRVLHMADIFCPNNTELRLIEEYLDLKDKINAPANLIDGRLVVVKDGERGAIAFTSAGQVSAPAFPMEIIDGTGAGDSFAGGLLYALSRRYDLQSALSLANTCGALTAGVLGPQAIFTLADVKKLTQ